MFFLHLWLFLGEFVDDTKISNHSASTRCHSSFVSCIFLVGDPFLFIRKFTEFSMFFRWITAFHLQSMDKGKGKETGYRRHICFYTMDDERISKKRNELTVDKNLYMNMFCNKRESVYERKRSEAKRRRWKCCSALSREDSIHRLSAICFCGYFILFLCVIVRIYVHCSVQTVNVGYTCLPHAK